MSNLNFSHGGINPPLFQKLTHHILNNLVNLKILQKVNKLNNHNKFNIFYS